MDRGVTVVKPCFAFGPFRLLVTERRLEKDGIVVPLGSRALDILVALVECAGDVVSKKDLISRVWPNTTVDESSLRVHVAGLRKALGDGRSGARHVVNIPGRGYCFVAPVTHLDIRSEAAQVTDAPERHRLPPLLTRMVGRDDTVRLLSEQIAEKRLVTIHGAGGIGKTTVAVAVGHAQLAAFDGAVCFFDLGPLSDRLLVPSALASALGLLVHTSDPTPAVVNFFRDRKMLLIFDSCEHVIDSVANLAERIIQEASQVSILATSREALRVEGEHVYRLPALDSPPEDTEPTLAEVLTFPAANLFIERAVAGDQGLELTDADAPIVGEICRKLDGIALAIELAAGRVSTHGLRETALLLNNRLQLLWRGRRTALPRHQTLNATLDWSYDLITDVERLVLRRLSVFVDTFTLATAQVIVSEGDLDATQAVDALAQLVTKSLVSAKRERGTMWYRLLDTTRAYAHAKLLESGEADCIQRRHAIHYQGLFEPSEHAAPGTLPEVGVEHLDNVRAALEWAFSVDGDPQLGVRLAASSARLFIEHSLLNECQRWTERALSALDERSQDPQCEVELQSALGHSLMFAKGNSEQAHTAFARGLELAEALADRSNQFRLLGRLHMYYLRMGNFKQELAIAQQAHAIAAVIGDPTAIAAAHGLLGVSHHLVGNQPKARVHLEASLHRSPAFQSINAAHFAFHRNPRMALGRTLWVLGFPDQAVQVARQLADETTDTRDHVTYCISLIWGLSVFYWIGDWETVDEYIERLMGHARRYSLKPYLSVATGLKGDVLVKSGDVERGLDLLQHAVANLRVDRYEVYGSTFRSTLAEGLSISGRFDEALATIDEAILQVQTNGGAYNVPELHRVRGEILVRAADERGAENCFHESMAVADRQSALSWRLRAAMSFARLRLRQGLHEQAHEILAETYGRFDEGFDTADLNAAMLLLDELRRMETGRTGIVTELPRRVRSS